MSTAYAYSARPIDSVDHRSQLMVDLDLRLDAWGIPTYRPAEAWHHMGPPFPSRIQITNNMALGGAGCMLVCWPKETPTIGVPMEIARAFELEIPIVVVADWRQANSAALVDVIDLWFDVSAGASLDAAVAAVADILGMMPADKLGGGEVRRAMSSASSSMLSEPEETTSVWSLVGQYTGNGTIDNSTHVEDVGMHDAGCDLAAVAEYKVPAGGYVRVSLGVQVEIPPGFWGMLVGRSSNWEVRLSVDMSVIDPGYRGPFYAHCHNRDTHRPLTIEKGSRIAQLILVPLPLPVRWERTDELSPSSRGEAGYGSTGR